MLGADFEVLHREKIYNKAFEDDYDKYTKDFELECPLPCLEAAIQLVKVLVRPKAEITAVQEERWTEQVRKRVWHFVSDSWWEIDFVAGASNLHRYPHQTDVLKYIANLRPRPRLPVSYLGVLPQPRYQNRA